MSTLQLMRQARLLTRFVLVWFALSLGVAMAAPLVKPQAMTLVCTSAGMVKLMAATDDGTQDLTPRTLDCPLCATVSALPPSAPAGLPTLSQPLAHALQPLVAAVIAGRTAAPLPPRGPPAHS